ncbi:hypothetical protein GCM10011506_45850 [Marivirga lumbricoides]|uniref:Viral A-type inclusion protein n=1 Tax=Marivirga lumbricoides TaxID=1046115 RepID=A0ABQ1N5N7_9BACT|nr:hypothetical protein GCM10011506_45850 [Marivirga lumbricoides]
MRKISVIYLFLLGFILSASLQSCNSKEKDIEVLKDEVISIHDEVMPRMDELMRLKGELKEMQNTLDSTATQESKREITRHITSLNKADEEMMNWMRKYDPQMENKSEQEKLDYLESQKIAIKMVRQEMLSAIAQSEEFLKNNN